MNMNEKKWNFASGEGERMVKEIRNELRLAGACQQNNPVAAREHKSNADRTIDKLLEKLAPRFQQYAWKCMGTKSQDDIDDAIAEMTLYVLKRVMDTSNAAGALFFEKLFNKAILGCINDAIDFARGVYIDFDSELLKARKVKKANNEVAELDEYNADLLPVSLEALDAQQSQELEKAQADSTSIREVEALFADEEIRQFVRRQSSSNQRLLEGWLTQEPMKDTAQAIGVCERTARNRLSVLFYEMARQILGPDKVAQAKASEKTSA